MTTIYFKFHLKLTADVFSLPNQLLDINISESVDAFMILPNQQPETTVYTRVQVECVYKSNPIFEAKNTTILEKV